MARTQVRQHRLERPAAVAPVIVQPPPTQQEKYAYVNRSLPYLFIALTIGTVSVMFAQVIMEIHIRAALVLVPFTVLYVIRQVLSIPFNFTGRSFDIVAHRRRVRAWRPRQYPVVDIYLPICGERMEVLRNTWTGVASVLARYPGPAYAHVLDDGDDPAAAMLAESFGFNYVVRPNRGWYRKSGNLRYAFAHTRGEFFLILDADFAPRPEILDEMLPYFDDPKVGIVQTPQFFRTSPEQTWVERAGAGIQEVFYRSIQVARNKYDAAICVGTCAVYRRRALEAAGGPALIAYAEDVHTGLDAKKAGYRLLYVPVNLATGICPDNVHAFVHQQCRWATGNMFTVMLARLWTVPMSLRARISHASGFFYYLSSAASVFTLSAAPVILLIFAPGSIQFSNLMLFGPSLFTGMVMYPLWHRSTYRLREVLPLTLIRGWAHVLAIWDYLRGKTLSWQPSGATVSRVHRLWWSMICWNGSLAVTWMLLAAWRIETTRSPRFLISVLSGILNCAVTWRAIYSMTQRAQVAEARRCARALSAVPRPRQRPIAARVATAAAVIALLGAAGGFAGVQFARHQDTVREEAALTPVHATIPATPVGYLGVYEPDIPRSYNGIDQFAQTVAGRQPNLVLDFNGWGGQFPVSFAQTALAHGATILIDLDPTTVPVSSIADGGSDSYLISYAQSVLRFGHPVVISFAHEMNGTWYNWGYTHVPAQTWIQAYRHVVSVFRQVGADNVTWMWTVNTITTGVGPVADWWPGSAYVDWVGIDGYYYYQNATFGSVFDPTLQSIRSLTSKPVLINETAVGPFQDRAADIAGLFAGVQQENLLGLVWFDASQDQGPYHLNWRLEGDAPDEQAFRQGDQVFQPPAAMAQPSPAASRAPASAPQPAPSSSASGAG